MLVLSIRQQYDTVNMWLFGIFSPILIFIIVHQVFIPQIFGDVSLSARKQKEQVIRNPVLKAVVIFSVMYTTRVFFSLGYTQMYTLWSLYLHALLYEHLGWNLILVILSVLVNRSRFFHDDAASICMTHLLFFTVSFTLLGIADVLADDGYVTLYEAILLPVLRLEILLLLPIAITVMQFDVTNRGCTVHFGDIAAAVGWHGCNVE